MYRWSATALVSDEATATRLAEELELLSPSPSAIAAFQTSEKWEVGVYYTETPPQVAEIELALTVVAVAFSIEPFRVFLSDERDWAQVLSLNEELKPVRAGRYVVCRPGDRHLLPPGLIAIEVEAEMAFGTGHHESTFGALLAIHQLTLDKRFKPRRIADIGCGTGVLAMAATLFWHSRCLATDICKIATQTAQQNAQKNRVGSRIQSRCCSGFHHTIFRKNRPQDLILSNILARPLRQMAQDLKQQTARRGRVVLSGFLDGPQSRHLLAVYKSYGFREINRIRSGEWLTLILERSR